MVDSSVDMTSRYNEVIIYRRKSCKKLKKRCEKYVTPKAALYTKNNLYTT